MKKYFIKISIICLLLLSTFNIARATNYYWIGGGGNWSDINHWATTPSGPILQSVVPGPNDDVFFTSSSGFTTSSRIITIDVSAVCKNMTWTGALNTPTITGAAINALNIYGSVTLQSGMVYNAFTTWFKSSTMGETITTNGTNVNGDFFFDGLGSWTFMDDFNNAGVQINRIFYLGNGTLNTNNKILNIGGVIGGVIANTSGPLNLPNTFNLNLGSSVITCNNSSFTWRYYGTGVNLNAGTSHIIMLPSSSDFYAKAGHNYYNVTTNSNSNNFTLGGATFHRAILFGSANITGSARFDTLIFSAGKKYNLQSTTTQTITATLTATAPACAGLIEINSMTAASQTNFYFQAGSSAAFINVLIKDIRATGAITPITANNSFDLGNNIGFTFPAAIGQTLYWVGGTGNWNDKQHWSMNNDGIFPASSGGCVPTPADDVVFNNNSGFTTSSRIVTLDGVGQHCHNMTWLGALNTPTITGPAVNALNIYGSLTLQSGMVYDAFTTWFKSSIMGETITTNGTNVNGDFFFDGMGSWTLMDDFNNAAVQINRAFYLGNGTLNTNNKTLNIGWLTGGSTSGSSGPLNLPNTFNLNLGSSIITCNYAPTTWRYFGTGANLNAGTSHIIMSPTALNFWFYARSGHTYYNVTGYGNSTDFNVGGATFHRVNFLGGAVINGSARFDSLIFSAGKTYNLQAGATQTITSALTATAPACAGLIEINSITSGSQANFFFQAGSSAALLNTLVKDIKATGSITPVTANSSFDLGNNAGFTFTAATGQTLYWVGGTGNWNDKLHWSTNNDGIFPASSGGCVPTPADDVVFNNNSGFNYALCVSMAK